MDEQKKQKVLIGVVAVLALGAGSYWYVGRDSGGESATVVKTGATKRKERTKDVTTGRKAGRKARSNSKSNTKVIKRKERSEVDRKTNTRKKRSRRDRKKVKKESLVPAA